MVNRWSDWEVIRRQVTLCGRVVADGAPLGEAQVTIEGAPVQTPQVSLTRADGVYFLLDLPAGAYTVTAEDARRGRRGGGAGMVAWNPQGDAQKAVVNIEVTPHGSTMVSEGQRHQPGKGRRARSV